MMAGRRTYLWAATAGIALVGAWLVVGLNPQLEQGPVTWASEVFDQGDRLEWAAVDPAPGEAQIMVSYRSTGPVPVRVAAVTDDLMVAHSGLSVIGEAEILLQEDAKPVVNVPRGGEFAVWQTLDLLCVDLAAGTGAVARHVRVDVTTLGITRRLELPLAPRSVTLWTTTDHSCPG
ncbi:hypothetical protein [Cellulomonas bogoriensis]|uniref:Uncharacterized protein n=1 Tax=Cellulomonas bogoriensis 69B4 = DSM 16987 TaxID=1386082 RepID=A0A0A0C255_9CELL|nr:hypothetical protein [Cellulomonas bogoriensis]KGM14230.1 hypothetical protein N869_01355 [Cellulomonas bogoriensis 69B4 = DSM 16987]